MVPPESNEEFGVSVGKDLNRIAAQIVEVQTLSRKTGLGQFFDFVSGEVQLLSFALRTVEVKDQVRGNSSGKLSARNKHG
jgi:hypothetical protein